MPKFIAMYETIENPEQPTSYDRGEFLDMDAAFLHFKEKHGPALIDVAEDVVPDKSYVVRVGTML